MCLEQEKNPYPENILPVLSNHCETKLFVILKSHKMQRLAAMIIACLGAKICDDDCIHLHVLRFPENGTGLLRIHRNQILKF